MEIEKMIPVQTTLMWVRMHKSALYYNTLEPMY